MRPLLVFSGQGLARADRVNLVRRLKMSTDLGPLFSRLPWRDRQNLDELVAVAAAQGPASLDLLVAVTRSICLKERRSTERKFAHRALLGALAAEADRRLVVHLTTNIDGLSSVLAARDFGASWPPQAATASLDDIREGIAAALRQARGFVHLPVHGEAALVATTEGERRYRTFYGNPVALAGEGHWRCTLDLGLAHGVEDIEERLPVARIGSVLLRDLLAGRLVAPEAGGAPAAAALPPADLVAIGYNAGSRHGRASYLFERTLESFIEEVGPEAGQRLVALMHLGPDSEAAQQWYERHSFEVIGYRGGDFASAVRRAVAGHPPARPASRPGRRPATLRSLSAEEPDRPESPDRGRPGRR